MARRSPTGPSTTSCARCISLSQAAAKLSSLIDPARGRSVQALENAPHTARVDGAGGAIDVPFLPSSVGDRDVRIAPSGNAQWFEPPRVLWRLAPVLPAVPCAAPNVHQWRSTGRRLPRREARYVDAVLTRPRRRHRRHSGRSFGADVRARRSCAVASHGVEGGCDEGWRRGCGPTRLVIAARKWVRALGGSVAARSDSPRSALPCAR